MPHSILRGGDVPSLTKLDLPDLLDIPGMPAVF